MKRVLLAATLFVSATAFAQPAKQPSPTPAPATKKPAATTAAPDTAAPSTPESTAAAPAPATAAPATETAPPPAATPSAETEAVRAELDAKVENAKRELREEIRAQMASQSVAQGWQEEWVEEKRKLELLELDGYLRLRPDLFNKLDLGAAPDPSGYVLFPRSQGSASERTLAGVNMRLRIEPTLNVSEEVRIKMQVDVLDNIVLGTSPEYGLIGASRHDYELFSQTQVPPRSGINSLKDSLQVRRVYGEVSTPLGLLRFGRMGSHWGVGMLRNDGNCLDCDFGDTVDRVQFVTEPLSGWYVIPMLDFNAEGPIGDNDLGASAGLGQPFDAANIDDAHSWVLVVARRDTDQQMRAKLENDLSVLNYGLHLTWLTQRKAFVPESAFNTATGGYVQRDASIITPDLWARFERKSFRVELELAANIGTIGNRALTVGNEGDLEPRLNVLQFGAVLQGEYRFLDGALRVGGELGYASGDQAPGLGNRPNRRVGTAGEPTAPNELNQTPDNWTEEGDIDGPQYVCTVNGCVDPDIKNFRFNRDYRIDMILWREILGGVTDAIYVKPTLTYEVAEGLKLDAAFVYSRAVFARSTLSARNRAEMDPNLGLEIDVGGRYETDDGFIAGINWGILFPLNGLQYVVPGENAGDADTAMAVRGMVGIRF